MADANLAPGMPVDLRRRLAPLAWAAVILILTSMPGPFVPRIPIWHLDKMVHLSMYAVLGALALWSRPGPRTWPLLAAVLVGASAFAAVDEWHQQFIVGRSQDRYDWLADTVGAGLGIVLVSAARPPREQQR